MLGPLLFVLLTEWVELVNVLSRGGEVSLLVGFVHFMSCGISVNNVQEGEIGSGNGFGFKLALYEVSVPMSPLKSLRRHS